MSAAGDRDRAHFDAIAAAYARKDLAPAARVARRHRLLRTLEAAELPPRARVLEAGCGAGFAAEYLRGRCEYVGIDHSSRLIELARQANGRDGATFRVLDLHDLEPDGAFDAVIMIGVLHHLPDVPRALEIVRGALKPGGVLLANEPQPGNPVVSLARALRKRLDPSYSADQRELSAAELRAALAAAGFEDVRVVPQGLLSTPLAEVVLPGQRLLRPLASLACGADRVLERLPRSIMLRLAWNAIAVGRRPVRSPRPTGTA